MQNQAKKMQNPMTFCKFQQHFTDSSNFFADPNDVFSNPRDQTTDTHPHPKPIDAAGQFRVPPPSTRCQHVKSELGPKPSQLNPWIGLTVATSKHH